MKHRNSHFAVGYWSRIRQGRTVPDQADIDPRALKRVLPFVFLIDARDDGAFIYRLAGTALCNRHGHELRGTNFLSHWDEQSRMSLHKILTSALSRKSPVCLSSIGATEDCRMIEIETVLLPITFGGEAPQRFLGIAQVLTDVISLGGQNITFERLVSASVISEGNTPDNSDISLPPPPPPPVSGWKSHPKAPHLRLVVSRPDAPLSSRPVEVNLRAVDLSVAPAREDAPVQHAAPDPLHFDPVEYAKRLMAFCGILGADETAKTV